MGTVANLDRVLDIAAGAELEPGEDAELAAQLQQAARLLEDN